MSKVLFFSQRRKGRRGKKEYIVLCILCAFARDIVFVFRVPRSVIRDLGLGSLRGSGLIDQEQDGHAYVETVGDLL